MNRQYKDQEEKCISSTTIIYIFIFIACVLGFIFILKNNSPDMSEPIISATSEPIKSVKKMMGGVNLKQIMECNKIFDSVINN